MNNLHRQNKTFFRNLAAAQLKQNKLQTPLTIITIMLSALMISTVLLSVSAIVNVNANNLNSLTGSFHAMFSGMTQNQYQNLRQNSDIEKIGINVPLGVCNTNNCQLSLSYSDADALSLNALRVAEGEMPQQNNEILLEKDYLERLDIPAGIGDLITLDYTNNQGVTMEIKFLISGYLETNSSGTDRSLYGAVLSEKFFESQGGWNAFYPAVMIRIKNAYEMSADDIAVIVEEITAHAGIEQAPYLNEAYIIMTNPPFIMFFAVVVFIIIIIMASILVVYCIFYISILNSIKEFGQLRTIGMTANQIKKLVFLQARQLSFRAIPPGLLLGSATAYLLVPQGFSWDALVWVYLLSIILVYLSVRISINKPAKMASIVSPMEALRFVANERGIGGATTDKPIGTPRALAKNQLKYSKKKNRLSVISLSFAGVLLVSVSSVLFSINARDMSAQGFTKGQFVIRVDVGISLNNPLEYVQMNNPMTEELYQELTLVTGVEKITEYHLLPYSIDKNAVESDYSISGISEEDMAFIKKASSLIATNLYQELVRTNGVVVGNATRFRERFGFDAEIGETITVKIYDGTDSRLVDLLISAIIDEDRITDNWDRIGVLMLPIETIQNLVNVNTTSEYAIQVNENMVTQADSEIKMLIQGNTWYWLDTLSDAIEQNGNFIQGLKLTLLIIVMLIGSFAIMNLINNILTGIISRQNEFALLRVVGITKNQLYKMVLYESMTVSFWGLFFSVILGGSFGALICMLLKRNIMTYLHYHFPFLPVIVYCLIIIICTLAITIPALKSQNKASLIEQLRKNGE